MSKSNCIAMIFLLVCLRTWSDSNQVACNDIAQEYFDLGDIYNKDGKKERALELYQRAIKYNVHHTQAFIQSAQILREQEKLDEAVTNYRKAVNENPNNLMAVMELANTLNMLESNEESLILYMRALEIQPTLVSAMHNFAFTLKKMGRNTDAINVLEKLLHAQPSYALAHFNLSAAYLSSGDFEKGFAEYEWRWAAYNEKAPILNVPVFDGKADLHNKSILITHEQGIGDSFQFGGRYGKILKEERGAYVILQVPDTLIPLYKLCPYIDKVIGLKEQPPHFDYHIPLISLPYIFKTTVATTPNALPYLFADPALEKQWKIEMSTDKALLKIGLCWHGNGRYPTLNLRKAVEAKSIPLKEMVRIGAIPGVSLYSLQRIDGIDQLKDIKEPIHVFSSNFDGPNGRFMDTAAVIKNLHVVVTVDTSIVHLAGALGARVFLILPAHADWRWITKKNDTPWYPGMRIFHQKKFGDWTDVINEVIAALRDLIPSQTIITHNEVEFTEPNKIARQKSNLLQQSLIASLQEISSLPSTEKLPQNPLSLQEQLKELIAYELQQLKNQN